MTPLYPHRANGAHNCTALTIARIVPALRCYSHQGIGCSLLQNLPHATGLCLIPTRKTCSRWSRRSTHVHNLPAHKQNRIYLISTAYCGTFLRECLTHRRTIRVTGLQQGPSPHSQFRICTRAMSIEIEYCPSVLSNGQLIGS